MNAEQLRPFIASAGAKVGAKRSDPADIARILADAAYSTAASRVVEQIVSESIPPAPDTREAAAGLARAIADLEASGYTTAELRRRRPSALVLSDMRAMLPAERLAAWHANPETMVTRSVHARDRWDELADLIRQYDALTLDQDRRAAQIEAGIEGWYAEHADEIRQIADQETAALMATPAFRLRAWLMAHAPADKHGMVTITAAVRWLATEYRCSEPSVWRWLSGDGGLPGWLTRELDQHQPPTQAGT